MPTWRKHRRRTRVRRSSCGSSASSRLFAFRWHPYAVEPSVDYAGEPTTLVEFELAEVAAGTRVTITESGFDRIPLSRRADAFTRNEQGWTMQTTLLEKFLRSRP